jgi:TolB-like protein/Flp pilus assembly protein TadD
VSFFDELKRRNVFKVGFAYAVGGWLLLQLTEVLSELLTLPPTIGPVVVSIVAIGFPIVIFIAWAFEVTPEGIKKEAEVDRSQSIAPVTGKKLNAAIVIMLSLAVVYLLYDKFSSPAGVAEVDDTASKSEQTSPAAPDAGEPEIDPRSIAVLPFTNRSRDEEDQFFVEGIHDDLLTNLARIGDLKVISRTSVLRFKDTQKPIPEIAAELGVSTIMEGAVQRSGETIRINVQLIDAQTDEHLWAEIFDRDMTAENLFAIQSEISQKIAEALQATLSPEEQQLVSSMPTRNLEAYNAYLRGRQLMARRDSNSVDQAMDEFHQAVEIDPEFALAWAAISENTRWTQLYSSMPVGEAMRIREEAANRALAINPDLGEALFPLAGADAYYERYEEAEAKFNRALELSPGNVQVYIWYADFLSIFPGRFGEALDALRKAEDLNPLDPLTLTEIGEKLAFLGRFEQAEMQLRRVNQMDPEFALAYEELADLMNQTGRFDEQVIWLKKAIEIDPDQPNLMTDLAAAYMELGDDEAVRAVRRRLAEIDPDNWRTGIVDIWQSLKAGNYQASLETGRWVIDRLPDLADAHGMLGYTHLLNRDFDRSLESYSIVFPQFLDRATWRKGIEENPFGGCIMSYLFHNTNSELDYANLLELTLAYIETELPLYVEHPDRYFPGVCYLIKGEHDKAMASLELIFEHGHHSQWWIWLGLPIFEPLRGEPRFESLRAQMASRAAEQRANLARIEGETGP